MGWGRANTWAHSKDTGANKATPEGKSGWGNLTGHDPTREGKCMASKASCWKCSKVGENQNWISFYGK